MPKLRLLVFVDDLDDGGDATGDHSQQGDEHQADILPQDPVVLPPIVVVDDRLAQSRVEEAQHREADRSDQRNHRAQVGHCHCQNN